MGMQNGSATLENRYFCKMLNTELPYDPIIMLQDYILPDLYANENMSTKKLGMYTAALFIIASGNNTNNQLMNK